MFTLKLWSIQSTSAYFKLRKYGYLSGDSKYIMREIVNGYHFISKEMIHRGMMPPVGVNYPVWAWYQWEGKRKRLDMRKHRYYGDESGKVLLTLEVPEDRVLLSDFDTYHYVLNSWYLPENAEDDKRHSALAERCKRCEAEKSWHKIFDLTKEDDGYIYGTNDTKTIQACIWQIQLSDVERVEFFKPTHTKMREAS